MWRVCLYAVLTSDTWLSECTETSEDSGLCERANATPCKLTAPGPCSSYINKWISLILLLMIGHEPGFSVVQSWLKVYLEVCNKSLKKTLQKAYLQLDGAWPRLFKVDPTHELFC